MTTDQWITWFVYVAAIVIAGVRIAGHTSQTYQAAAHLFVGGLFAAAFVQWRMGTKLGSRVDAYRNLAIAVVLTIVEVGCFLWFRFFAGE